LLDGIDDDGTGADLANERVGGLGGLGGSGKLEGQREK
jgi:hypothetical protein